MTFIAKPKTAHPSLPRNPLGMTRRDYEGATLREHYGLPRPTSRYAAASQQEVMTSSR